MYKDNNIKVAWLTCTKGRHSLLERNLRFFLNQDYENKVMIIFNNSPITQRLGSFDGEENVILINQHVNSITKLDYDNLGAIYNDAIDHIPEDVMLLNMADDDDCFMPNHLSAGVEGYLRAKEQGLRAYKPRFSYYHHAGGIVPVANVMEPSIFVEMDHIRIHGFHNNTKNQHHKWLDALGSDILVEENGKKTLIYDWNNHVPTWKTSGDPDNPSNFLNYSENSQDHGDGIITPWHSVDQYYNLICN